MDFEIAAVYFLLSALALLVVMFAFLVWFTYKAWKDTKEKRRMLDRLLHLEYFSLYAGRMILPEGKDPTYESEAKRFDSWRMN